MSNKPQKNVPKNLESAKSSEIFQSTSDVSNQEGSTQTISTSPIIESLKSIQTVRLALLGVILIFMIGTLVLLMKGHVDIVFCLFGCSVGTTGGSDGGIVITIVELISLIAAGGTLVGLTSLAGVASVPAVAAAAVVWLLFHIRM